MRRRSFAGLALAFGVLSATSAVADTTYHNLFGGAFTQDWSNTGLITANDVWTGVASVEGYRGDDLTTATGVDPQTLLAFAGAAGPVLDVNANQTNPDTFTTGGLAEFHITNPVVGLNGSGTADAPFLIFYMDATNVTDVMVNYVLRDLDGSADNAVSQVALQYRIGNTGDFVNVPAGYVADASQGPSLSGLTTPVSVLLPSAVNGASMLQIRVLTTNAVGNDEWIGVDDINISATAVPEPASMAALALGAAALIRRRRK